MRTFIAVEIPDEIKKSIAAYVDTIKPEFGRDVKWVKPENLHLTIKFLGEIQKSQIEEVKRCVADAVADIDPFTVWLSGLGFFPTSGKPRVLWLGTDGGEDVLLDIYQDLETRLEGIGFDRDSKPFSPHLTIGRVKRNRTVEVPEYYPEFDSVSFDVSGLAVVKSRLTPEGPIYERMCETPMNQDVNVC